MCFFSLCQKKTAVAIFPSPVLRRRFPPNIIGKIDSIFRMLQRLSAQRFKRGFRFCYRVHLLRLYQIFCNDQTLRIAGKGCVNLFGIPPDVSPEIDLLFDSSSVRFKQIRQKVNREPKKDPPSRSLWTVLNLLFPSALCEYRTLFEQI